MSTVNDIKNPDNWMERLRPDIQRMNPGSKHHPGCLVLLIVALLVSVAAVAQRPPMTARDSVMLDSVNKLIKEKLSINAALIDSTFDRIEATITHADWKKWSAAYQYFVNTMIQVWLDDNRKRKQVNK